MRIYPGKIPVSSINEHHPLQQGLRPLSYKVYWFKEGEINEHHPLQQGLRLAIRAKCFSRCQSTSIIHYNKD